MSRFRVMKSKGKFYVVTTDSNGLAGGPYEQKDEAEQRAANLAALEAKQAERLKQPERHKMNITPGYRSADVEDGRAAPARATEAVLRVMPPSFVKWNTPNKQPLPPGWVPPWKLHSIPVEEPDPGELMKQEPPPVRLGPLRDPLDLGPPMPPSPFAWPKRKP